MTLAAPESPTAVDRLVEPSAPTRETDRPQETARLLGDREEPPALRRFFAILAVLVVAGFFYTQWCYWTPAHPGVDQNGYLVGGKMLARTLTMRQQPTMLGTDRFDPHQFVGQMWVGTEYGKPDESYYPKYPIGYPLMIAIALLLGGDTYGPIASYWINPVAMTLAVAATFLLVRTLVGSFPAILAMLVFATSPTTIGLATNPNSHATAVCCVTWGMFLLMKWWKEEGQRKTQNAECKVKTRHSRLHSARCTLHTALPFFAGFLLGYACTIRYTEGTLLLPLTLVAFYAFDWRSRRSWIETALLFVGWLIPVGGLVAYNLAAMGTLTGYDPTNESSGFRWEFFVVNWDTMFRHLAGNGLFFIFPLAVVGMVWMFWWNWRVASVVAGWIVPCATIYTFYYWAPDGTNISYLRFYLTVLPGLCLCAFWMLDHIAENLRRQEREWTPGKSVAVALAVLLSMAAAFVLVGYVAARLDEPSTSTVAARELVARGIGLMVHDVPAERVVRYAIVAAIGAACGAVLATALKGHDSVTKLATGLIALVAVAVQAQSAAWDAEFQPGQGQIARLALDQNVKTVLSLVQPHSVIICRDTQLLHHLQFVGDYRLYSGESFDKTWVNNLAQPPDREKDPQGLDPGRRQSIYKRLKDFDQAALNEQARTMIATALDRNLKVYFVIPRRPDNDPAPRRNRNEPAPTDAKKRDFADPVRRFAPADRFDATVDFVWRVPDPWPTATGPETSRPRGRQLPRTFRGPQTYQIVEVTKAAAPPPKPVAAPKPATKPTSTVAPAPVTKPTTAPTTKRAPAPRPASAPTSRPVATSAPTSSTTTTLLAIPAPRPSNPAPTSAPTTAPTSRPSPTSQPTPVTQTASRPTTATTSAPAD